MRRRSAVAVRRAIALVGLAAALFNVFVGVLFVGVPVAGADGTAGMRVYRDPTTGAFTSPPPDAHALLPSEARTATPPLVETQGTSAAGGIMVDLRGAFQSSVTATVDETGVHTHCDETTPTHSTR